MNGTLLVEAYLLAQMRASDLVDAACRRLGLDSTSLEKYRAEAEKRGLSEPGHPMGVYVDLLGKPLAQERMDDADPYRRRRWTFALPLWPEFVLVVHGSEVGQVGGVTFASFPSAGTPPAISTIEPWRLAEEQMANWSSLRIVDEWYPMKDYEALIQVHDGSWALRVLQFDYGLLQATVRQ
ncbi:hypothetical protein WME76_42580 [Sorangium sp. So ce119]|uniref:hypothetical protein n=1 Tax=Sorangium sp. So ce119 TaxID=3133279 RepID=UPI003F620356